MLTGTASSVAEKLLLRMLRRRARRLVVIIDGGSGSGKSVLAAALMQAYPYEGLQLVNLDDCYPGWEGLAAGAAQVTGMITGRRPGYWQWDWERSAPKGRVDLDPNADLLIEGCGALTPATQALADFTVWCQLNAALRKERALARDGEMFRLHWDEWARQERYHWASNHPRTLADEIVQLSTC